MEPLTTKFIQLQEEMSRPSTAFMRQVYENMDNDIYNEFATDYDTFSAAEVQEITAKEMKAAQDKYKHFEDLFVTQEIMRNPRNSKLHRQLASSPPPPQSDNGEPKIKELKYMNGYDADLDADLSSREEELTKHLERGYARRNKLRDQKLSRAKRMLRLQYLAHRMQRRVPEILNARMFIAQAEVMIFQRGGNNPAILKRLREAYNVHNSRASKASTATCLAIGRSVDSQKARQFDEDQYTSGDSDHY